MRKLFCLLIILFLLPLVTADVGGKDTLTLNTTITSELEINQLQSDYVMNYVKAILFFQPIADDHLEVIDYTTEPDAVKNETSFIFKWYEIDDKANFTVKSNIKTKVFHEKVSRKVDFPIKAKEISFSALDYMQQTETVDFENETIKDLANEIAAGEDDLFIVVNKMGLWVRENIDYSLSTVTETASQKASWVLENEEGVCDELTNLFIALNRAAGIPARFVSGMAYTTSPLFENEWGMHGWAEVYFPEYGWIPFDVTYGQFGWLDASHVKLKLSMDATEPSVRYEWRGRDFDVKTSPLEVKVEVEDMGNMATHKIDMVTKAVKKEVGLQSYNLLETEIENKDRYYKTVELTAAETENLKFVSGDTQTIILQPFEKTKIYWEVKVEDGLEDDYEYTFPIMIFNQRNQTSEDEFKVKKDYADYGLDDLKALQKGAYVEEKNFTSDFEMTCTSAEEYLSVDLVRVDCKLKNLGNVKLTDVEVCVRSNCKYVTLGISEEKEIFLNVKDPKIGMNDITVTAESGKTVKTSSVKFEVKDEPMAKIDMLKAPEKVKFGDQFELEIYLKKESFVAVEDITLFFKGDLKNEWLIEKLDENQKFNIKIDAENLKAGKNNITVEIKYFDDSGIVHKDKDSVMIEMAVENWRQKVKVCLNRIGLWIENFVRMNKKIQNL